MFDRVPGVTKTTVGYTGGRSSRPTYRSVCGGDGHAEAIKVEYDEKRISYEELLEVFWKNHRPRAGEKGQYRSAIWFHDEAQQEVAEQSVQRHRARATGLAPVQPWTDAEGYHQKYYARGSMGPQGCACQ
mmetsp:Transcript_72227/g.163961  ORF Transcript_72227/g.163961 Transcript_72227/m.163961 type:complete len:130 (-) Transcript_72227:254-643(-)